MPTSAAFDKAYNALNSRQREAVDAIEGPVMVVAGPGTGKTQILALRIAAILARTDTAPESILALTFTESGARAMRKRLIDMLGNAAYRVNIYTFHGLCNEIIRSNPDDFPRIIGATLILPVDQVQLMEKLLSTVPLTRLRPFGDPLYYLRPSLSAISELKRENISPAQFLQNTEEAEKTVMAQPDLYHLKGAHKGKMKGEFQTELLSIEKNKELAALYASYQEALSESRRFDYDDMILEAVRVLGENSDLLLRLQEQYQYILADEHQDANGAQNKLLELLASFYENPNLFVVGDEKQAIFRFQGATLENFLYFKNKYKEAQIVQLEDNYRSGQHILDAAHSLVLKAKGDSALRVPLLARAPHAKQPVRLLVHRTVYDEIAFTIQEIKQRIKDGVPPEEIAIIYRTNSDAHALVKECEREGVPFALRSDQNVLDDPLVQRILMLLRSVASPQNEQLLAQAIHLDFLGIPELDLFKILADAKKNRRALMSVLLDVAPTVAHNIALWHKTMYNVSLLELLEQIMRDSGIIAAVLRGPDPSANLLKLHAMFDIASELLRANRKAGLPELVSYIQTLEEQSLSVSFAAPHQARGVELMTAHRSKGLEFDYVYVLHVVDGHWGNRRAPTLFRLAFKDESTMVLKNDDERRLLYVALTRGRKQVTLSYYEAEVDGAAALPSQFISEMDPQFLVSEKPEAVSSPADFLMKAPSEPAALTKQFLQELFAEQGLSVTALNNYLACPWRYFYSNLLRVPRAQDKYAQYGTAVHEALKRFFDKWTEGEDPGAPLLLQWFREALQKLPLTEKDFEESLARGEKSLEGYYKNYKGEWPRRVLTEFGVQGILLDGETKLRGNLDKIEYINDGTDVVVVDYKTSKPKTRNELLGKTKTGTGDYFRQLVFYKLLLQEYDPQKFRMIRGDIDFIEPDDKGRYHKEAFEVEDTDVEALKDTIRKVAKEIRELVFWNNKCEEAECEYCFLRDIRVEGR